MGRGAGARGGRGEAHRARGVHGGEVLGDGDGSGGGALFSLNSGVGLRKNLTIPTTSFLGEHGYGFLYS